MAAKYFVPDDNPCVEEMTCSICLNVWIDPVEVKPCSHTYCADCLGALSSCPDCRSPIATKSKPNRIISNLLYVLSGRCSRCGWRGTHGEFSTHHNRETCSSAGLDAAGDVPKGTTASDALSASSPHTLVESAAERGDFAVVTEDGRLTCMLFPALPDPSVDGPLSLSTGLETREGGATVMISTSSKPWRAYGLSKEVYDVLVLAFFAFAEQVPATLAPFPEMASDDRDTASDNVVDLSKRTILLLRPEAVKRCLWWLNASRMEHDRIVDELFPSFGLSLPQAPDQAQSVNDKPLPRPREGLLASRLAGASDSVVYGVTQHQYLSWLGWNASRLSPPLTEYGLFSHHYEELLNYARTEDADQTGAFEPAAVERVIKKLVEVRAGGPSPSPVSIRSDRVLEVLMQRRASATRDAANRPPSKLILVGPSYPPGEFLLHDVLLACRSVQVDEAWCEVSKEDVGASPTDPRMSSTASAVNTNSVGNSVSTAAFHSEGAGKVDPKPTASHSSSTSSANLMVPSATAVTTPPPKMGLFQRLFGKENKPQPQPHAAHQSSTNPSSAQYPSLGPQRQQQQAMGTSTPLTQQQRQQLSQQSRPSASSPSSYPAQASGNSIHSQQQAQQNAQQQQQQQYNPPQPGYNLPPVAAYAQQQPQQQQQHAAYRLPAFANIATNTNNSFPYNASTTSRPPAQNQIPPSNVNFPNNYNQQQQQPQQQQYYQQPQPPQQQQQQYYQQQVPPSQVHPQQQQQQPYGAYGSQPQQQAAYYGQHPQQPPPAGYGYGVPPPPRQPNYPTPYGQQQQGTYPNYGVNYQNYQRRF